MKRTLLILTLTAATALIYGMRGHRQFIAFDSPFSMGDHVSYAADEAAGIAGGHGVIIEIAIDENREVSYTIVDPRTHQAQAGITSASITH